LTVFLYFTFYNKDLNFKDDIKNCLKTLKNGGLILYPTDTIWGIGCDATNEEAVKKIFALKKRTDTKSFIVLMADEKDISKYVAHPHQQIFDYLQTAKKPTTVIYNNATGLANNVINADGTVAIRIVKEIFCQDLIKEFGKPVISTSANISGKPSPENFAAISMLIKESVDYIVNYRRDDTTKKQPSAIVKFDNNGNVIVLRS
jgi:L-threonylcarbamoyladenylate synthase